ncbi:TIGR04540 family protein [Oceanobacillus kimchii]|uniref:TIGR04540 family protein n=1 Tax=Oceanobacillus kimchii TaxID=746691 RepID=UPI0021A4A1AB|nr:TIGR04540 family protein [Oceanobacillus kimchii]MCT1577057.1 TIGR04540 family protein [Oceanobacillus kimchii]MCT2135127.1 TIGR04540 family protein [Oceanobacillus kimchii]
MDIKLFQKTQRDLATTVNSIIDEYWKDKISEREMIDLIHKLYSNNEIKFVKEGKYTTVLQQQCGKRRLEVVSKILNDINSIK